LLRAGHAEPRSTGTKDRSARAAQEPAAIWTYIPGLIALVHDCTPSQTSLASGFHSPSWEINK